MGDDAIADFGYAEDDRRAGERAESAGDPDDGEGQPNAHVIVGLEVLGDYSDDACGDDHVRPSFYSTLLMSVALRQSYNVVSVEADVCVETVTGLMGADLGRRRGMGGVVSKPTLRGCGTQEQIEEIGGGSILRTQGRGMLRAYMIVPMARYWGV